jgi:crotonobetainyl-CoA:carnitine CoA-transferase CaiB-like acyl-CoA transferase
VVQLGGRVSTAYAARLLGDLGATVYDLRPVDPDEARPESFRRALQLSSGRNKIRVEPPAAADLAALLERVDVVFTDESGPRPEGLPAHVVVVDTTDFGDSGPRAHWHGSDLIDVAYGGGCQQNGEADRSPLRPPAYVAEHEIGVGAAVAALIALAAARRDGLGQHVEVSGVDSWATIQTAIGLLEFVFQGRVAGRAGRRFPGRPYPYGILPSADGDVRLICLQGREWVRSLEMMGDPEWGSDPKYRDRLTNQEQHADELDELVGRWLGVRTKDEVLAAAIEYKVAWAPLRVVEEVLREPQLTSRGFFVEHDGVRTTGFPARFGDAPHQVRIPAISTPVPAVEVLRELPERAPQPETAPDTRAPLAGLTVLDFGWAWAGGVVGSILADYGADVIKIESMRRLDPMRMDRPLLGGDDGTEQSSLHHNVNRNKRSVSVDISTPKGAELVRGLAEKADVLIENLSPGALAKYGLDHASLSAKNDRLVYLSLNAVGTDGPLAGLRAYAPVLTALSGIDSLTGYTDGQVIGLQHGIGDPNASLHGVLAILAALHERDRTGKGRLIDLSQLESLVSLVGPHLVASQLGQTTVPIGNRDPLMAPHGIYPTGEEDRWVAIAVRSDEDWQALRTAIGSPDWAGAHLDGLAGRLAAQDELDKQLAEWTATRDRWEIAELLQAAGVAATPLLDTGDRFSDDHLQGREVYTVVEHPVVGSEFIYNVPWRLDRTPGEVTEPAPLLGQHTADVLQEYLGKSGDEVEALRRDGALA